MLQTLWSLASYAPITRCVFEVRGPDVASRLRLVSGDANGRVVIWNVMSGLPEVTCVGGLGCFAGVFVDVKMVLQGSDGALSPRACDRPNGDAG